MQFGEGREGGLGVASVAVNKAENQVGDEIRGTPPSGDPLEEAGHAGWPERHERKRQWRPWWSVSQVELNQTDERM